MSASTGGSIVLTAYSMDGTNSGTARLGRNVTIQASTPGLSGQTILWTLSGPGTLNASGLYTAPAAMPSNTSATVTATLASNSAISASYTMSLIYAVPTIRWITPSNLLIGATNAVTVVGYDFTPATTILVNGARVAATFQAPQTYIAQVPVAVGASGPLSVVAQNPTPGGGNSASATATVQLPKINLTAYSSDGTNAGIARLGHNVTVQASTPGLPNATYVWSVAGGGTITAAGLYTAPAVMPSNSSATVTATLASNPAVSASYKMVFNYVVPTIRWITPSSLIQGTTTTVTIVGYDFTPATTIQLAGKAVAATYQAPQTFTIQVPVSNGATQPLSIVALNPAPGGGSSAPSQATIQLPAITLTAYSVDGTNSGTARLGRNVTIQASSPGLPSATYVWTVTGGGSITSSGVYTAPATMPANGNVTVTATLSSNSGISASYTMALTYAVPTIRWITPATLLSGITNSVTVYGYDFTPATTILVGGTPVPTAMQVAGSVVAQIPVGAAALDPLSIVAVNPTPGGGSSPALNAPVQPLTIKLSSYNNGGLNPTSGQLGLTVQYVADVAGSGKSALPWAINWSVSGGGTISSTGLYQAPATMPSGSTATITASLALNSSVTASSQLALVNPAPAVNQSSPMQVTPGQTNTVTFTGVGFGPGTSILVNGTPVATTYVSPTAVQAPVAVSASATAPLTITAQNPSPGGGTSAAFSLPLASATTVTATVGTQPGLAIAGNFLGLSHDWNDAQSNIGSQATGVNYIYRQLVKNLSNPGSPFFIRIGGGSTDQSAAPTPTTLQPFVELANAMPVHFSLGINLGANDLNLAEQQASFFVSQMPSGSLEALEIGNEPDLYVQNGYRPANYNLISYETELAEWEAGIMPLVPSAHLMGAAWATPWYLQQNFNSMEQQQSGNIPLISQHFYAGSQGGSNVFPSYYLLQNSVSTAWVPSLRTAAATAHANGQLFRMGEMNSIDNGGLAGVSDTFSAALWAIDTMFEYANAGVDGVNFHGTSGCSYCAFTFNIDNLDGKHVYTLQQVNPLYYGLLFFHQATTNTSRLLPVTVSSTPNVKVWATVDQAGTAHVAVLNKDLSFSGTVAVTLPGYGTAAVTRLAAPSYQSTDGISIGDQTFDGSMDGNLLGTPSTETLAPSSSVYQVNVQPTSAVLLTLPLPTS